MAARPWTRARRPASHHCRTTTEEATPTPVPDRSRDPSKPAQRRDLNAARPKRAPLMSRPTGRRRSTREGLPGPAATTHNAVQRVIKRYQSRETTQRGQSRSTPLRCRQRPPCRADDEPNGRTSAFAGARVEKLSTRRRTWDLVIVMTMRAAPISAAAFCAKFANCGGQPPFRDRSVVLVRNNPAPASGRHAGRPIRPN